MTRLQTGDTEQNAPLAVMLEAGEVIVWRGKPSPWHFAWHGAVGAFAGGLLVGSLGLVWMIQALLSVEGLPGLALACLMALFVTGGLAIAAAPIRRYRQAAATIYLVTGRQAVLFGPAFPGGRTDIAPSHCLPPTLRRHLDGTVSVFFFTLSTSSAITPGRIAGPAIIGYGSRSDGFIGIRDADLAVRALARLTQTVAAPAPRDPDE